MKLHTELSELFRGNLVVTESKEAPAPAERATTEPAPDPAAAPAAHVRDLQHVILPARL